MSKKLNNHEFAQEIIKWICDNPIKFEELKNITAQKCIDNTHYDFAEEIECAILQQIMFIANQREIIV